MATRNSAGRRKLIMIRTAKWAATLGLSLLVAIMTSAGASGRTPDPFAAAGGIWTVTSTCALDGIGFVEGGMAMIYYKGDGNLPGGAAFYSFNGKAFSTENLGPNVADPRFKSTFLGGALRPDGTLFVVHGYTERGSAERKREECVLKPEGP